MEDGIRRIQKTVTNLLEFARNPSLEKTATDFRVLTRKTISLLDYQFRKNRIKCRKRLPEIFLSARGSKPDGTGVRQCLPECHTGHGGRGDL